MEESLHEITLIIGAIHPQEATPTILLALIELPLIGLRPTIPDLLPKSMLLVVLPFTLILASIQVLEASMTISFALKEVSFIVLSIGKYLAAISMGLVSVEGAFVLCTVWPKHHANAILNVIGVSEPLALVHSAIIHLHKEIVIDAFGALAIVLSRTPALC
jgi:hypothetical protein